MPAFLEAKLKKQYGGDDNAVFGTMNKIGVMRGSKETPKGAAMQAKHDADTDAPDAKNVAGASGGKSALFKIGRK